MEAWGAAAMNDITVEMGTRAGAVPHGHAPAAARRRVAPRHPQVRTGEATMELAWRHDRGIGHRLIRMFFDAGPTWCPKRSRLPT